MGKRGGFVLVALYLLLITSVEFGVPYALRVHHEFPMGKDAYWHLENLKIIYNIATGEGSASIEDISSRRFYYPPLLYFVSLPFCLAAGKVGYAAAYLPYLAIWFMLNLGLYLLARDIGGLWAGVLAPLAFLGYRQIVYILGVYNLTIPLCAWLPFLLMLAFRTEGFLNRGRTLAFFALLALSFLTYLWVVQFMFFPVIAVWLLYGRPYKKSFVNILLGAVVGLVIVSPYLLGPGKWPLHHFLTVVGGSKIDPWSGFFREGSSFYIDHFFKEPLNWLLICVVPFAVFKGRKVLTLLIGGSGAFLLLHPFKVMHIERLIPLYVFTSVILACGIAKSPRWLKGAVLIVLFSGVCLTFQKMDGRLSFLIHRGHNIFNLLSFLEKDCRKHPSTNYVWRVIGDDAISTYLWTSTMELDCVSNRMALCQDFVEAASDEEHRLLLVAHAHARWTSFCASLDSHTMQSVHMRGLWMLLCNNASRMRTLYSNSSFEVLEVPNDVRLVETGR